MVKTENDCCGCELPCIDCGRKRTVHTYCDECKEETEVLRECDGEQLCEKCLLARFPIVEVENEFE